MNIIDRLNNVMNRRQVGVAKITGELGGGSWAAQSQGGGNLVLTGSAVVGGRVFYDIHSNTIISAAPELDFIDLAV